MRVLVIGGTAFMGPVVVRLLAEDGHEVTVLHRGQTSAGLPPGTREILGDRNEAGTIARAIDAARPDVVLDMYAMTESHAHNLVGTAPGRVGRLVVASSADVYRSYGRLHGTEPGPAESMPLTEGSPLRERRYPYRADPPRAAGAADRWMDDYDKIPIEQAVMEAPGIEGTVLRLPMVYGPGDRQHRLWDYLRRMDARRPAIILGETVARWRTSRGYVDNIAAAIALAVTDRRAAGRIYNVAEPHAYEESEWVRRVGEAAGWKGEVVIVPDDELPKSLQPSFDARHHLEVDSVRIRKELDYGEPVPFDEALRRTVAWQRANPPGWPEPGYAVEDALLARRKRG